VRFKLTLHVFLEYDDSGPTHRNSDELLSGGEDLGSSDTDFVGNIRKPQSEEIESDPDLYLPMS